MLRIPLLGTNRAFSGSVALNKARVMSGRAAAASSASTWGWAYGCEGGVGAFEWELVRHAARTSRNALCRCGEILFESCTPSLHTNPSIIFVP